MDKCEGEERGEGGREGGKQEKGTRERGSEGGRMLMRRFQSHHT